MRKFFYLQHSFKYGQWKLAWWLLSVLSKVPFQVRTHSGICGEKAFVRLQQKSINQIGHKIALMLH